MYFCLLLAVNYKYKINKKNVCGGFSKTQPPPPCQESFHFDPTEEYLNLRTNKV